MGHEQVRYSLFERRHRTPDGRSRGAARTLNVHFGKEMLGNLLMV